MRRHVQEQGVYGGGFVYKSWVHGENHQFYSSHREDSFKLVISFVRCTLLCQAMLVILVACELG